MAELGIAASVAGLISLSITVFQGCVRGIHLIGVARSMEQDTDRLRSILEWEEFRLLSWGERAGLMSGHSRPSPQLNWTIIYDFLKQLETLLTDTNTLAAQYNLRLETQSDTQDHAQKPPGRNKYSHFSGLWAQLKPEMAKARTSIIKETKGVTKRFVWTTLDQDKLKALLSQIGYFNNCLNEMLAALDRDFVRAALSSLLRVSIARSGDLHDLETVQALIDPESLDDAASVEAAANTKQLFLQLTRGNLQTNSNAITSGAVRPKPKLSKLRLQWFNTYGPPDTNGREEGLYEFPKRNVKSEVMLEWKQVAKSVEKKLERRIQNLTSFMSSTTDESFHSLRCLGYLVKENAELSYNEYAYVFELVDLNLVELEKDPPPIISDLQLLLSSDSWAKPSLSSRVQFALTLAETVLQLHTSGWLHKAILPSNVLFISKNGGDQQDGSTKSFGDGPYLAGYEFARVDNPLEMTETTPPSPYLNLYRHPSAQGPARESFCKEFDLYALGCLLLELSQWRPLPKILMEFGGEYPPEFSSRPPHTITATERQHEDMELMMRAKEMLSEPDSIQPFLKQTAMCAGELYADAVFRCFCPVGKTEDTDEEDDVESGDESAIQRTKSPIQDQLEIVSKLAAIRC